MKQKHLLQAAIAQAEREFIEAHERRETARDTASIYDASAALVRAHLALIRSKR